MVGTLADSVAASLRCGAHALHRHTLVNENLGDEQFTVLCLAVILASQLAIAERSNFSTFAAAAFLEKRSTPNARFTSIPRTMSTT